MTPELMWALAIIIPIMTGIIAWIVRKILSVEAKVIELIGIMKDDIHDFRLHVAENYTTKKEFDKRWGVIEKKLDQLLNRK